MIKLIKFLLGMCNHEYPSYTTTDIAKYYTYGKPEVVGKKYTYICIKCGNVKTHTDML